MPDLKFDLEDDLSTSDLRKVDEWERRLANVGKLRVQRSGKVLGVLLSTAAWRELQAQSERTEQYLRLVENALDELVIAKREGDGPLLQGAALRSALEQELKRDGLI